MTLAGCALRTVALFDPGVGRPPWEPAATGLACSAAVAVLDGGGHRRPPVREPALAG